MKINTVLPILILAVDGVNLVDRPTQLICISDIYMSTYKYKRHSTAMIAGQSIPVTRVSDMMGGVVNLIL